MARLIMVLAIANLCSAAQAFCGGTPPRTFVAGALAAAPLRLQPASRRVPSPHAARAGCRSARRRCRTPLLASLAELDTVNGVTVQHEYVRVASDVTLHVAVAGDLSAGESTPTICLLHGFPDFWLSWRRQIPGLVQVGRTCASDRPFAASTVDCAGILILRLQITSPSLSAKRPHPTLAFENAFVFHRPDTGSSVLTCEATASRPNLRVSSAIPR